MNFSRFFVDKPIFAAVLSIVVFVAGLIAIFKLPISEYPNVVPPSVVVRAQYPGADPKAPGHTVTFHADGEESFKTLDDATYEAVHVGKSIIEGTHPDLSVLSLVTSGV